MRSTLGVFAFGLAASVAAHEHHNHMHLHQERAATAADGCRVEYFTSTSYGEWGLVPVTSSAAPVASSSSAAAPSSSSSFSSTASASSTASTSSTSTTSSISSTTAVATSSSTSQETSAAVVTPTVQYKVQVASSTEATTSAASTTSATAWGDSGYISANGDKWAFCYTPYTTDGQCKTADVVLSDLTKLKNKGFTSVRTYGNDCSGVANIGTAARSLGLQIILGVPIDGSGVSGASGHVDTLAAWGKSYWDIVEMVVVGNEAIFSGYCSASELVGLIATVKTKFAAAGYSGPVTTTEPLGTIQQYSSIICPAVDVAGANIHPYFNDAVSALLAGPFATAQLALLSATCGGKQAYILETGWPSAGSANGIAIPGVAAQKIAITGIMAAVGSKAAVFSYENDMWKSPGTYGVEQYWGCAGLF